MSGAGPLAAPPGGTREAPLSAGAGAAGAAGAGAVLGEPGLQASSIRTASAPLARRGACQEVGGHMRLSSCCSPMISPLYADASARSPAPTHTSGAWSLALLTEPDIPGVRLWLTPGMDKPSWGAGYRFRLLAVPSPGATDAVAACPLLPPLLHSR